jgi:hypothetical protein
MMQSNSPKFSVVYGGIIAAALVAFVASYYFSHREPSIEERTRTRAEMVGRRLIEDRFEQKVFLPKEGRPERGLASSDGDNDSIMMSKKSLNGDVGRDAWGQPFHFQVKGDGISNSTLYIWSHGPNGNADYREVKDMIASGAKGDDILVEMPF